MTGTENIAASAEPAELEALVERAVAKGSGRIHELVGRADDAPEELVPYLPRLLAAGVLSPAKLYRAAGSEIQRALVAQADAGGEDGKGDDLDDLLGALAETRGPVTEAAFRRWRDQPPPGADQMYGPAEYLPQGGWVLEGDRFRELCGPEAYTLAPLEDGEEEEEGQGGQTTEPPQGRCQGCGSPLWVALDLDTADARIAEALAHVGWSGRLRIVTCYSCHPYDASFFDVAPDGTCHPPDHSARTPRKPLGAPTVRLAPEAPACDRPGLASAVGGYPEWLHDAEYPACRACGTTMSYIAQIYLGDLWGEDLMEGFFSFFLHTGCGVAAMVCQG